MTNPFHELLLKLAEADPDLKKFVNSQFDKAKAASAVIKERIDPMLQSEGYTIREVSYGLIFNAVVNAYVEHYANRAEARDDIGELIDGLFDAVDTSMDKRGVRELLTKAGEYKRKGFQADYSRTMTLAKEKMRGEAK